MILTTAISPSEEEPMAREYFCAYHSLLEGLQAFSDAECGRLFRACLKYSSEGTTAELSGNERFIWPMLKNMIDRDKEAYSEKCETNRLNGEKGGRPKNPKNPTVFSETEKTQEKEKEEDKEEDKDKEKEESPSERERAHKHGEYGWIRLTETQYRRLLQDLGPAELDRCIQYIDESAQRTGNKNKWKDWNLTIRKCAREGWGKDQSSSRNVVHKENRNAPIDTAKLEMLSSMFQ